MKLYIAIGIPHILKHCTNKNSLPYVDMVFQSEILEGQGRRFTILTRNMFDFEVDDTGTNNSDHGGTQTPP